MQVRHDPSRRRFLATSSVALLGAGLVNGAGTQARRVRSVIHLFMEGGMSHLDTFDPKHGNDAMATDMPGVFISRNLPGIAQQMDKITLVRSMSHTMRSHGAARSEAMAFPAEWKFTNFPSNGENGLARNVIEAGKLVRKGERFVRVELGGWDTHTDSSGRTAVLASLLDNALSSLLDDLSSRGALDETLIVVSTEFGRSVRINEFSGSNHHPHAYTCLLAGGGFGGQVIGATADDGMEIIGEMTSPAQFIGMIAARVGYLR